MMRVILVVGLAATAMNGAAMAATPAAGAMIDYPVKAHDTLEGLARRYMLALRDAALVARLNGVRHPRRLTIGQVLHIPADRLKVERLDLKVTAFAGLVAAGDEARPAAVTRGSVIREGDVIVTGPNAFVTLAYGDGSVMTLPSLTRARVEALRRILITDAVDRRILIERGRGEYQVAPLRKPNDRFEVRTPMAVAAIRGTEFRVAYDDEGRRSALGVLEGRIAEHGGDAADTALVTTGTGAVRSADAPGRLVIPLPPAPEVVQPGRIQDEPDVVFDVAAPKPDYAYRVQLSRDAGFTDLFAEAEADHGRAAFKNVANGTYFVRVTAVEGHGVEGIPAVYAFDRSLTALAGEVSQPPPSAKHKRYAFKWRASGDGRLRFQFILARDPDLHDRVVDQVGLTGDEVDLIDLEPGVYYWRVVMTQFNHGKVNTRALKVNTLRIASAH